MSCFGARGDQVPSGFFGVQCVGPTPYVPRGASKFGCGKTCANPNQAGARPRACNFYQVPPAPPQRDTSVIKPDGWTDVGFIYSTDAYPVVNYLNKSCTRCDLEAFKPSAECTGCQASGPFLDDADEPYDVTTPAKYRENMPSSWAVQRPQNAYERNTMNTNNGAGYGFSGQRCCRPQHEPPPSITNLPNPNGMRHGQFHASGCKDNRCQQDLFQHPAVSLAQAPVRRFKLYAKPNDCGSSRWQYAVLEEGVQDSLLISLPTDPRQPPWQTCSSVDFNRQAWLELATGDFIYVPGQPGVFQVQMWADVDHFRPNQAVFRGYSPVRRLPGRKWRKYPNSGLRNFTSHPSANGLLRPF